MSAAKASQVTLRALEGEPLEDDSIRSMVLATAEALAERHGLRVLRAETSPESITVTLNAGRIESIGFAAELRRLTTAWYTRKYGLPTLWGEAERADEGEEWKKWN